ncbi:unnamed protein product [Trichobilharzia regenti]|nr:unnamed protein product [Trichobilharzia regenti]
MGNAQALEKRQLPNGRDESASAGDPKDFETRWRSFMNSLDVSSEHIKQIELLDENKKTELLLNYKFLCAPIMLSNNKTYFYNTRWVYDFLDYEGLETLTDLMFQCLPFLSDTKTLTLDMLTALCLIEGGHVTCVQFLNIVVHSPENINLRVYLQYELHLLGFDDLLKQIRDRSGSRLKVQIEAYLDNRVDCSLLLEDAEAKEAALLEQERLEKALQLEINTVSSRVKPRWKVMGLSSDGGHMQKIMYGGSERLHTVGESVESGGNELSLVKTGY